MALEVQFPDPSQADNDGLVAVGGNLTTDFLLAAYAQGLFPWYNEGDPILWWSPNPRMVLFPDKFICSKSLQQILKSRKFTVRADTKFKEVIHACASVKRGKQEGTWITKGMIESYINLHHEGYAHSIETYFEDKLVGGLYGVSLGKAFFGESMFYHVNNASKVALFHLKELMLKWKFYFIDVQQSTKHLRSLGAEDIERDKFLRLLKDSLNFASKRGKWTIS